MNVQMNQAGRQQMNMHRGRPMRYNNNRQQYNNQGGNMMNQMPQQPRNNMVPQQPNMMPPQPVAQPPMPKAAGAMPPQMPGMPMPPQQVANANMTVAQKFQLSAGKFINAIDERNPLMKDQVGNTIYEFITDMVGPTKAPKITGMLINLPLD